MAIHLDNGSYTYCGVSKEKLRDKDKKLTCYPIMCSCSACYSKSLKEGYNVRYVRLQNDPAFLHYQVWKMMKWFTEEQAEQWRKMLKLSVY